MAIKDNTKQVLKVCVIAGEVSGDKLGAQFIEALRRQTSRPLDIRGIGGERLIEEGMKSWFPMDELSLMGFFEILPAIRRLKRRLQETAHTINNWRPDIVLTIDSPGFCHRLTQKIQLIREQGAIFVHYVAPSVWAYHPRRAEKLAGIYDYVLALMPFEPPYFSAHGLQCSFIGHALTEDPILNTSPAMRHQYGLEWRKQYLVGANVPLWLVMPGSRRGEWERHWPLMCQTIERVSKYIPDLQIVIPVVSPLVDYIRSVIGQMPVPVHLVQTALDKRGAFCAVELGLVKSGTSTLEVALYGIPMVVTYSIHPMSALLMRYLLNISTFTLINLVREKPVVPEYMQARATPVALSSALYELWCDQDAKEGQCYEQRLAIRALHHPSGCKPSDIAVHAVLDAVLRNGH
jgi:lipid-A-disaccharide synthase